MKKRYLFILLAAMLALGLVFTTCDMFEPGSGIGGGTPQETWDNLDIVGEDVDGKTVRIEFSRPAEKQVLTPKTGDNYKIFLSSSMVSSGTISVSGNTVTFIPAGSGTQFYATIDTSKRTLDFPGGTIPLTPTPITGFHTSAGGGGVDNSAAYAVVALLNSSNATVDRGNVVIKGPVIVAKNVPIPVGVKLIFNTASEDEFKINRNVSVTAKGGIEVSSGKGVTISSEGSLILEGNSTVIKGELNIGQGTTLDIAGNVSIESGGTLSLAGNETVDRVFNAKYSQNIGISGLDAVFKVSGISSTLSVKKGGRLLMPDPFKFDLTNVTGAIDVEAGGELILLTAEWGANNKAAPFLHPWIGTVSTKTTGVPIGADFVMDSSDIAPVPSKIRVRANSGIPALELVAGRAVALGRLILDKYLDSREPPYRLEVFVNYPFTVADYCVLQVGNSKDYNLHSSLMVTGPDFYNYKPGLKSGVLTVADYGRILIFENSGVVECFGGFFDHNNNVKEYKGTDSASTTSIEMAASYGDVHISGSATIDSLIKVWKNSSWKNPPWLFISG